MADPRTDAETLLRAGDPKAALTKLTEAVRAKPADAKLRIFLAQLLCVLGQWERAHTQLNVVADLDKLAIPMRETVGHAIRSELSRAKVFAGQRPPMVFGHPDEWLALLIESLLQAGRGDTAQSVDLAARAFEAAPAVPGAHRRQAIRMDRRRRFAPRSRCSRPASTGATTGSRSRGSRASPSTRRKTCATVSGCPRS